MKEIKIETIKYESIDGTVYDSKDECVKRDKHVYADRIHLKEIDKDPLIYWMIPGASIYTANFENEDDAKMFWDMGPYVTNRTYCDDISWFNNEKKYLEHGDVSIGNVVIVCEDCYITVFDAKIYFSNLLKIVTHIN